MANGRFPKFHLVLLGRDPGTLKSDIEIRHRVNKTSTINLFGFETLKLKIRRLKLWKPTVHDRNLYTTTNKCLQCLIKIMYTVF